MQHPQAGQAATAVTTQQRWQRQQRLLHRQQQYSRSGSSSNGCRVRTPRGTNSSTAAQLLLQPQMLSQGPTLQSAR